MQIRTKARNVDAYITGYPEDAQKLLKQLRTIIRKCVPEAEEIISYGMPAYRFHGMLVFFAAYKNHIGFYPTSSGIAAFKKELSIYKGSKGAVQFPIDKPLPQKLIAEIVSYRKEENLRRAALKRKAE